jgi:transcription elongation factor Elf1
MTRKNKRKNNRTQPTDRREQDREPKSFTCGHCAVCGTPLCTQGGCAGTGMCGPCCTGEAETAGEY